MKLRLDGVTKSFAGKTVLDGISADFGDARAVVFIGPSGGGKSTLLRAIAGLEAPEAGAVAFDGEVVDYSSEERLRAHRRRLGVVFQAFNLFPHLTAVENITLALEKVHGQTAAQARETALATLRRFRLDEHGSKKPAELSGGQKQRVAIARAIATQPRLLLFDEPTSALDPEMTAEVLELIEELKAEGRDFILVTHEMGFARRVGDTVAFLADGRIVERDSAARLFEAPQSAQCRDFLARVLRY
jgi:polar amino acid transport system ATP-binding protein